MTQIFNIKEKTIKKGLTIRVKDITCDEYLKLRQRVKQFPQLDHNLDEEFDKAISKIIKKANNELDAIDADS